MLLKKINRFKFLHIIFVFVYCLGSQVARANCTGANCSCSVETTGINFGIYNPTEGGASTARGHIIVTCVGGTPTVMEASYNVSYCIKLSRGTSNTYLPRFMQASGEHLNYNLYTTEGMVSVWGDGTEGTVTLSDNYAAVQRPTPKDYTVFAKIFPLQKVGVGTYSDMVTVTVTY